MSTEVSTPVAETARVEKMQITDVWLKAEFAKGRTVEQVLGDVNDQLPEGQKLSIAKFTQGVKSLGIDLKKKPRPMAVQFVSVAPATPAATGEEQIG
jgi:hypothetical protein